jgi:hypothetical protein
MSKHTPEDLSVEAQEISELYGSLSPLRQRVAWRVLDLLKQAPAQYRKDWMIIQLEKEAALLRSTADFLREYPLPDEESTDE